MSSLIRFTLLTTLVCGIGVAWLVGTSHVTRGIAVPILILVWLTSLAFAWAFCTPGKRLRRLWFLMCIGAVGTAAAFGLFRYEGSSDGSARPKFSWRWTPPEVRQFGEVAAVDARQDLTSMEGVVPVLRFMGESGDGVVERQGWSTDWKTTPPREVWRMEIGEGWGGFAVDGSRVFTQEQRGTDECVSCYALSDGSLLWLHRDEARFEEAMGGIGPRGTPTLSEDLRRVYSMGATGILHCLDVETGAVRWTRQVLEDFGADNLTWGKSNSPLLHGGRVIVNGGASGPTLAAYDAGDGSLIWQAGSDGGSYSSPIISTLGGVEQFVSVNAKSVTGHAVEDGQVLWTFPWPGAMPKVSQPIPAGTDHILVTASYGMKSHLLKVQREGQDWQVSAVWSAGTPRTKFSSPSVVGDHLYAIDEGTLACVSLEDGRRVWREGRFGYAQHLLCPPNWLLILSEPGDVVLVRAEPEGLREMARMDALSSKTWNPPTLAGRWLLVRNDRSAVCFELPEAVH